MKVRQCLVAASAALVCGVSQAGTVIDLFSTSQAVLVDSTTGDGAVFSQAGAAGDLTILGGFRDLSVELKQQIVPGSGASRIGVAGGYLSWSNDSLTASTGIVRWDGSNAMPAALDPTGLGGINLGNALTDSFELLIIKADAGFDFTIEAYTDAGNWSKVTITSVAHPLVLPNGTASYIPLLAFLDCDNNIPGATTECAGSAGNWKPVDFSNLGALQVVLDPTGGAIDLDLTLNQVTVVPEPGALALVGLALGVAGAVTRRRKV